MSFMKLFMVGTFVCLGIFLFVTAPAELPDESVNLTSDTEVGVSSLFNTVNAINDAARLVYTKRIVGNGKAAGLRFGEDWSDPGVEKGPLPALFLRLVARQMERKPQPLGLYLGSDEPINKSNLFSPEQLIQFRELKQTKTPQFSISATSSAVAMYPDFASAQPCVDCHNDHRDSPKTDWQLGDVMGATTWTYPSSSLSVREMLVTSKALFASVAEAYQLYLEKAAGFSTSTKIGQDWPSGNLRALPDVETFMHAVLKEAGLSVAQEILAGKSLKKGQSDERPGDPNS